MIIYKCLQGDVRYSHKRKPQKTEIKQIDGKGFSDEKSEEEKK